MVGYPTPPPVTADELRPRRLWYWVAGLIAASGLLAGILSGAYAAHFAVRASEAIEELDPQLQPVPIGVPTPVELEAGRDWAVYVSGSGPTPRVSCGGDGLTVTAVQQDLTTVQDAVTWHQAQLVRVGETGRYSVVCTSPDRTTRLALGKALDGGTADRVGAMVVRAVLGFVGAFAFASLGVLVGGLIALVVGLRRSSHRAALRAWRGASGP